MHKFVGQVFYAELSARRSEIALFVEVGFIVAIDTRDQCIRPNVELPTVYEQRIRYVFLNDAGPSFWGSGLFNDLSNVWVVFRHRNSITSVGVLTRLYDPNVLVFR